MRRGDEDVSERISESCMCSHSAEPRRLEELPRLGPDAIQQVQEPFERR
jgi:hypothetical protein